MPRPVQAAGRLTVAAGLLGRVFEGYRSTAHPFAPAVSPLWDVAVSFRLVSFRSRARLAVKAVVETSLRYEPGSKAKTTSVLCEQEAPPGVHFLCCFSL